MKLWNDYEGKVLAERYTLGSLLRPEGRSALFTYVQGPGAPAIMRITESLNDEGEMLGTWRRLPELKQEALLSITDSGETVFDSIPLTYAVLEPTDANLDELLAERALTQAEALQVATAVAAALSSLHAADLMHGHVAANNVFAVGETVKLRADCVRRCIVDGEFVTSQDRARLIQQDVKDFGTLLLRGLTLEKRPRPGQNLPAPFNQIVPRALDGTWGLTEITKALTPHLPKAVPQPAAAPSAAAKPAAVPAAVAPAAVAASPAPARPRPAAVPTPVAASATSPAAVAAALKPTPETQTTLPYPEPKPAAEPHTAPPDNPLLYQRRIQLPTVSTGSPLPKWAPLAIAAALVVAFVLFLVHGSSSAKTQTSVLSVPAAQSTHTAAAPAPAPPAVTPRQVAASAPEPRPAVAPTHVQPGWYVIAYTFNHEEQALKRAAALVRRYPGLHPQVIAPSGNAYMVALGGAMSRNEAESTRNHARRAGLPRDTFVRNYGG